MLSCWHTCDAVTVDEPASTSLSAEALSRNAMCRHDANDWQVLRSECKGGAVKHAFILHDKRLQRQQWHLIQKKEVAGVTEDR